MFGIANRAIAPHGPIDSEVPATLVMPVNLLRG
ncbi:unnamed protein product, partial [marine sediment metagenome]